MDLSAQEIDNISERFMNDETLLNKFLLNSMGGEYIEKEKKN